jgi:hypothetical protein
VAGSRPRKQFYTGGQKKNQTVSDADTKKAAALPLTTLLAVTLTVGEALVVARAASVAAITSAMVSTKKMTSNIPPLPGLGLQLQQALVITSADVQGQA